MQEKKIYFSFNFSPTTKQQQQQQIHKYINKNIPSNGKSLHAYAEYVEKNIQQRQRQWQQWQEKS